MCESGKFRTTLCSIRECRIKAGSHLKERRGGKWPKREFSLLLLLSCHWVPSKVPVLPWWRPCWQPWPWYWWHWHWWHLHKLHWRPCSEKIVTAQLNLNSTRVGVTTLLLSYPPATPPTPPQTFKALPGNLGSWFSVCNLILTQLERLPHKNLEDDLKKKMEDDLQKKGK